MARGTGFAEYREAVEDGEIPEGGVLVVESPGMFSYDTGPDGTLRWHPKGSFFAPGEYTIPDEARWHTRKRHLTSFGLPFGPLACISD